MHVTAIHLGRASLHGSVPPTRQLRGATSTLAYLVLLRVEIARFTRGGALPRHGWLRGLGLRPSLIGYASQAVD